MSMLKKYIRYRRIIKALKLKDTRNMRQLVLKDNYMFGNQRGNGKTIAFMVKSLVDDVTVPDVKDTYIFAEDPDYRPDMRRRMVLYITEYRALRRQCEQCGIKFDNNKRKVR